MLLQQELNNGVITIKSYQPGKISVSGTIYQEPILLSPTELKLFEATDNFSTFEIEMLIPLLTKETEIVIVGSGDKHQFLPTVEIKKINVLGVAFEVMSTRQACHTFQVLLHDNRKVLTLLFP